MNEFVEQLHAAELQIYIPSPQTDMLLARWWIYLTETGDFDKVLTPNLRPLSEFLHYFHPPHILTYATDSADHIWFAAWIEPWLEKHGFLSLWIRRNMRASQTTVRAVYAVYDIATAAFQTLLGITRHERLLRQHEQLGYTTVGRIPRLLTDDSDTWIVYLTREAFLASDFAKKYGGK